MSCIHVYCGCNELIILSQQTVFMFNYDNLALLQVENVKVCQLSLNVSEDQRCVSCAVRVNPNPPNPRRRVMVRRVSCAVVDRFSC